MKCERCEEEHDGDFGSGRFCSKSCANSRVFSEESKKKKSESNKKRIKEKGKWGCQLDQNTEKFRETWKQKMKDKSWEDLGIDSKRIRVILDQNGCCHECGINEWRGQPLTLETEHIDGDHSNNTRENVIALCPNCHSITPTWRGRNVAKNRGAYTDQEILEIYHEVGNIRQTLLRMGYAAKGDNYVKIKRIINRQKLLDFSNK